MPSRYWRYSYLPSVGESEGESCMRCKNKNEKLLLLKSNVVLLEEYTKLKRI